MNIEIEGMTPLLQVYDMPTTLAFYRDILGFTVVESSWPGDDADWTWLRWHGNDLMFNTAYDTNERPGKPDFQRLGPHSDTSIYFGCPNIDTLYEYLLSKNVSVEKPQITKYGWKSMVVKDPDNFLLIFHWPVDNKFEAAVDAIVSGDVESLQLLLKQDPGLIRMRSTQPHQAMLLHYIGANGVEHERQKTPPNAVEVLQVLLQAGAEVDAEAAMYGGATTLGLVATSCHPEAARLTKPLLTALLQAGANINYPNAGGNQQTAIIAALHNYQPEAAFFLAEQGAELDFEAACAVGNLPLVKELLNDEPYTGLNWACLYGHINVVAYLISQGVDINRQAVGFPPIQMATVGAHHDIIRLLLANNASLDTLNEYGGDAIRNALWVIDNRRYTTIWPKRPVNDVLTFELLLAAGAAVQDDYITWVEQENHIDADVKEQVLTLLRRR